MSASTILLVAFIAILAFKGLFGDTFRPAVSYPPYGPERQPAFGSVFGIIAGLLIAFSCLWLLLQIELPEPGQSPAPTPTPAPTEAKPNVARENDTLHPPIINQAPPSHRPANSPQPRDVSRDEFQPQSYENDDGARRGFVNQAPPEKRRNAPSKAVWVLVAQKYDTQTEATRPGRRFKERGFVAVQMPKGMYWTCIFIENPEQGLDLVHDFKKRRADWKDLDFRFRIVDLGRTCYAITREFGSEIWHCEPN